MLENEVTKGVCCSFSEQQDGRDINVFHGKSIDIPSRKNEKKKREENVCGVECAVNNGREEEIEDDD